MILEDSPFRGRQIDFLNIDCEGSEQEVLESLDFSTYQPRLVAVEIQRTANAKVAEFMNSQGCAMTHRLGLVRIFLPQTEALSTVLLLA